MKSIIVLAFLIFLFAPTKAYGQEVSFGVSPAIMSIQAHQGEKIEKTFLLQNNTDTPLTLDREPRMFATKKSGNGEVYYSQEKVPLFETISFFDETGILETIYLGPKQKKQIRFTFVVPSDEKEQDYYFSIIFISKHINTKILRSAQNDNEESIAQSNVHGSLAMHVLLSIIPINTDSLPSESIETFATPWFTTSTPISFLLNLENTGKHVYMPTGTILIRNVFGQAVKRIDIPQSHILAYTNRSFTLTWDAEGGGTIGPYTAELTVALSDKGPLFTRTISFVILPLRVFFVFFLGIGIILLISSRLKRYR